jgi:hypothetical protein
MTTVNSRYVVTTLQRGWVLDCNTDIERCSLRICSGQRHGEWNKCRLQRRAVLRLQANSFVDEVCIEAMAESDAGNRSAGLGTLLNDLGLEGLGIGTACWLHEIPA